MHHVSYTALRLGWELRVGEDVPTWKVRRALASAGVIMRPR